MPSIQDIIAVRIKEEIETDPDGVGYAGKTDAEVQALLNNPVRKQRIVEDSAPAPINRILAGIANMPNTADVKDIEAAKIVDKTTVDAVALMTTK